MKSFFRFFYKINNILLVSIFLLLLIPGVVRANEHFPKLIIGKLECGNADVYVDGGYKGQTPITIKEIAFGEHQIRIVKEGYYNWEETIVVSTDTYNLGKPFLHEVKSGCGRLQVNSEPEKAKLILNYKHMGYNTPFDILYIKAGKYKLTLEKPDYLNYSQDITIYSGKVNKIDIKLKSKYGKISLTHVPMDANIYLDGQKIDDYIKYFEKIPVGPHQIKIYKYGWQEWSKNITVNSEENTSVEVALIPAYGSIEITSQPEDAEISLNNRNLGFMEKEKMIKDLLPDSYKITLTKTGYKDWTKEIEVFSYKTTTVSAQLQPWFATLNLTSEPSKAQVYLNGKYIGSTPLDYNHLIYGTYKLELRMKRYHLWQKELEVNEPKNIYINNGKPVHLKKINYTPLAVCLILPVIAILYYLFILPAKRRKKEELPYTGKEEEQSPKVLEQKETEVIDELENNQENIIEELLESSEEERIETIEDFHNNQKKDIHRGIKEKLPEPDKPIPDDPITSEYQQIQEKMEEQANIRSLFLETQEEAEKAIAQAKEDNNSSRLSSFKDLKQKINDLSRQFEYGKLPSEKVNNEIELIKNQMNKLSKKRQLIKGIKPRELNKKTREIREKKKE